MSYGIQLLTMFGMVTIANQIIPVYRATYWVSGSAGSIGLPADVSASNGMAFASIPNIRFTFSGSTLNWSNVTGGTTGFTIYLLRFL